MTLTNELFFMNLHHGQIVERIIRRNGYSISELARLTNVNRRSVYNWFNQKYLKAEIIYRIGSVLNYDFSDEFPDLFPKDKLVNLIPEQEYADNSPKPCTKSDQCYWKDKYIDLLERYNDLLVNYIEARHPAGNKRDNND